MNADKNDLIFRTGIDRFLAVGNGPTMIFESLLKVGFQPNRMTADSGR